MRIFVLSFFLFNCFASGAQPFSDSLESVLATRDLAKLQTFFGRSRHQEPVEILNRQLFDKYYELSYETHAVPGSRVCALVYDGRLVYTQLFVSGKKKSEKLDTLAARNFLKRYRSFFGSKVTLADLFADTVRYGAGCGFVGADPPARRQMQQLVADRNQKELTRWLQSPTTEKQLYGVEGFTALISQGYKLTRLQKKLIRFIKKKQGNYLSCNAAVFSSKPISGLFGKGGI